MVTRAGGRLSEIHSRVPRTQNLLTKLIRSIGTYNKSSLACYQKTNFEEFTRTKTISAKEKIPAQPSRTCLLTRPSNQIVKTEDMKTFQGKLEAQGDRYFTKLLKPKTKCLTLRDAQCLYSGFNVCLYVCLRVSVSVSLHRSKGSHLSTLSCQVLQLLNDIISIF